MTGQADAGLWRRGAINTGGIEVATVSGRTGTEGRSRTARAVSCWVAAVLWCVVAVAARPPAVAADEEFGYWPANVDEAEEILRVEPPADADADVWAARAWALSRYRSDHVAAAEAAAKALALAADHYRANELAGLIAQMRGEYDSAFHHYLKLLAVDRPESELYVARTDTLNLSREQDDVLLKTLQTAAEDPRLNALYRDRLRWRVADMLVARGRLEEARREYARLAPVTDWMVIGPFANEENAGFGKEYGPETEIDYDKSYEGRDRPVSWQRLRHVDPTGAIDFDEIMYPNTRTLAYALTFVRVAADTEAVARFGSGQAVKLWINDRLAFSNDEEVDYAFDQYAARCRLKAGWNKVLVKVCERSSEWKVLLRFTAADGSPLAVATEAVPGEPLAIRQTPKEGKAAKFPYTRGVHEYFVKAAAGKRPHPAALYYLMQAESLTNRTMRAVATGEKLVARNRQCSDHHALLARAYEEDERPEKALTAMKRALEIEPEHLECLAELGRFYGNSELFEKALATLRKAVKQNPEWPDAQYFLLHLYQGKGWEHEVWRQARWLLERKPTTVWVLEEYARQCRERGLREPARRYCEKVLERDYGNLMARMGLIALATEELRLEEALKQFEIVLTLEPLSINLRLQKARLLMEFERYDEALAECAAALEICAENSRIHRLMGDIRQRQGVEAEALAAWRTALRYDPDDKYLREYLEFREPETIAAFEVYGVGEEEAAKIVQDRVSAADYPKADAVVLLDHLVTQLNEDGSYTALFHQIVQVLNDAGREQYTSMSTGGYNAKIKRAVVIQPDGTEVEATRVSGSGVEFGQLQAGSIVELKAQWRGSANEWLSRHYTTTFRFQSDNPVRRSQFVLLVPTTRKIRYEIQGERPRLTQGEFEDCVVYDFRADDLPMLEPESNRPPPSDLLDLVAVSTIEDWSEVAAWEYSLIKDQFVADDAVRQKARELTEGLATREEKLRAIAGFVAQKIQYRQDYDRAIMGMKPHKAGNVLEKQAGDCKDQANLLITLLREVGIDAKYTSLRTRSAGKLRRGIPSNQCNHAIVYVPGEGDFEGGRWLDPTSNYGSIDTLPWQDQGVEAIVFREGAEIVFLKTPVAPPEESLSEYRIDVRLREDGAATVGVEWKATGQYATSLRAVFEAEGLRRQRLEQFANFMYPGGKVGSLSFSDLEDRERPVNIRFEFEAPNVGQVSGRQMVVKPKDFLQLTQRYADRSERNYPLWLPYTSTQRFIETYHLPEGYSTERVPPAGRLENEWMAYELKVEPGEGRVRLEREFVIRRIEIPLSAYESVRGFCVEADKHEREPLILVRPEASSP